MDAKTVERFMDKVDVTSLAGCWEWTAAKKRDGYGLFKLDAKMVLAHRLAFLLARGHWPEQDCSHLCHNPSPITTGLEDRFCSYCNATVVIPERVRRLNDKLFKNAVELGKNK